MSVRLGRVPVVLWLSAALFSNGAWALGHPAGGQREARDTTDIPIPTRELHNTTIPEYQFQQMRNWAIFGRVTTLDGQPVSGAKVHVDIGVPAQRPRTLQTNLQGEFRTEYGLDAKLHTKVHVDVVAAKSGYRDAWETADFEAVSGTREINLILRHKADDFDVLPSGTLIASLAPRFRAPGAESSVPASGRKDYMQGVEQFLDRHDAPGAVKSLSRVVSREPDCVGCRTVLSLALLDAGSWVSANRQLAAATVPGTSDKPGTMRPEPLLILGVLETWRHETKKAIAFFLKALEVQPADPLVLQELGRALVLEQKWDDAEKYLQEAIKLGASPEARLLRARALLEAGKEEAAEEAQAEMKAYLAGRRPKDLPARARPMYLELQERLQLKSYGEVKPLVNRPLKELVQAVPELKGLEPAPSQDGLPLLLQRVGESVETFFRNFPNTVSLEDIREERLDLNGKILQSQDGKFNYLFLAKPEKSGLGLDEYRTSRESANAASSVSAKNFMRTTGFACAPLVLLPAYQPGSSFRYLGTQTINGRPTSVLAFAQQPGKAAALTTFNADGKLLPVLMQGIVWFDPSTYEILRMRREILKPPPKSGLEKLLTEIHFAEVQFKGTPSGFWLPHEVTVTVHWKKRIFRNRHRYSDFRLFRVETEERRKTTALVPNATQNP
jgi:tetratricopeptide (TPR) repeat protein